ncbi:MAG: hypothetical protein WBX11_10545 [Thiobacillaceae bacterium]|jgi:hypothetical protein
MFTVRKTIIAVSSLLVFAGTAHAAPEWLKGTPEEEFKTLATIQPGLGTVMIEYSNRFSAAYYAAKGGNWDMAGYQIKEAREIQEVGETTRPGRAKFLKEFESTYLDPLDETIKAKDWKKFEVAFKKAEVGCNECHKTQGFHYIKYQLPKASPSPTSERP